MTRQVPPYPEPYLKSPSRLPDMRESCRTLSDLDIDANINIDFEENSPYQEGIISEIYGRPDMSYVTEPPELDDLLNTSKLEQKSMPKQTDIDKILEMIQREVFKGTHLPIMVKEIQVGYLIIPYFRDLYLYLAQNQLISKKVLYTR